MRNTKLAAALLAALWSHLVLMPLISDADPAHFWLSDNGVATDGPAGSTSFEAEEGVVSTLYIWGRPETGKKLRNISLNLVTLQAGVDFIDGSITVYNDAGNGIQRYEYVSDSTSTPALTSEETQIDVVGGTPDVIELLQGFSLSSSSASVKGVGNQCVDSETGCVIATDGQPAWLLASVDYNVVVSGPRTDIHLQIGEHGINHETLVPGDYDLNGVVDNSDRDEVTTNFASTTNLLADGNDNGRIGAADYTIWRDNLGSVSVFEDSSLTSVRFGADAFGGDEPIYNGLTDRQTTQTNLINLDLNDDPDASITIVPPKPLQAVPEPSGLCLLLLSLCCLRTFRRQPN